MGEEYPKVTLKCIGRTDSLGDPHEYGPYIGFVLEYPGANPRHRFVLEEADAELLASDINACIFVDEPTTAQKAGDGK